MSSECPVPIREREVILIGHGSGGRMTSELLERVVVPALSNPTLDALDDAALLHLPSGERIAFTTDSYVVSPIFFPGGDIGDLAVNCTINDLAVSGARPIALSLAFILEEGFPIEDFRRVVASVKRAADRARVSVVTGDTKVVGHGSGDGVFVNTSGVGVVPDGLALGSAQVRPGDAVIVSGTIGDHGVAILAHRQGLAIRGDLRSDTAPLHELTRAMLEISPRIHAMRDPTRGGLAATLVEIATRRKLGVEVFESALPVRDEVRGACEILGLDPAMVANEGKLVAFIPEEDAGVVLEAMRAHPLGKDAACIGRVTDEHAGMVVVRTPFGSTRVLDLPLTEPLPRIC